MKDLVKFVLMGLVLVPCVLVFNEGTNMFWNVLGVVYLFVLAAYVMGNARKIDELLRRMEKFEKNLMDVK